VSEYQGAFLPSREGGYLLKEGSYSDEELADLELLARLVSAEARGEPREGQIAVAAVILNRLSHREFPKTIAAVIFQPGQFQVVANGAIYQKPHNSAYEAALAALRGSDPTGGALFFWNPAKVSAGSWVWSRPVKTRIGSHVFA